MAPAHRPPRLLVLSLKRRQPLRQLLNLQRPVLRHRRHRLLRLLQLPLWSKKPRGRSRRWSEGWRASIISI